MMPEIRFTVFCNGSDGGENVGHFIELAKRLKAVVIANDAEDEHPWHNDYFGRFGFLAIGGGVILRMSLHDREKGDGAVIARIESALSPVHLRCDGHKDRVYVVLNLKSEFDALPHGIASAMRDEYTVKAMVCVKCGRTVTLTPGGQYCPHCGAQHSAEPVTGGFQGEFMVCTDCPCSPADDRGNIFHPAYRYCPRCGKKLVPITGVRGCDYLEPLLDGHSELETEQLLASGLGPGDLGLDPADLPGAQAKGGKKPKRLSKGKGKSAS